MKKYLMMVLIPAVAIAFGSCGGGSSSSTDAGSSSSASTVDLTGSIQAPVASTSISSPSLSKNIASKAISESAAANISGHIYTLEGEDLGSFTTDSSGAFTVSADLSTLKGSDDTGSSFSEPVICDCDNGIQLYAEVSGDSSTTSISIGTGDADTTLAAASAFKNVSGFSMASLRTGTSFKTAASAVDLKCLFETEKARWENASLSGGGVADDNGAIRETMMAFMASGRSPADAGFSNGFSGMFNDVISGNASSQWSTVTSYADDFIDSSYHAKIADYSSASSAVSAMNTVFSRDMAEITSAGNTAFSISNSTSKALSTSSICDDIESGAIDPDALIKTMYEADNVTDFEEAFSSDGMKVMFGFMEQCQVDRAALGVAAGASTDPCKDMIDDPDSYFGIMDAGKGYFGDVYSGGSFDATALDGWMEMAKSCEGSTEESKEACLSGMVGTMYDGYAASGTANWSDYMTSGTFDEAKMDTASYYWLGQYEAGTYNPETFTDYHNAGSMFENTNNSAGGTADDALQDCIATKTAGHYAECYGGFDSANSIDSGSGSEMNSYWQGSGGTQFTNQYYTPSAM